MTVLGAECILKDILAFSTPCTNVQDLMNLNFCSLKALWVKCYSYFHGLSVSPECLLQKQE